MHRARAAIRLAARMGDDEHVPQGRLRRLSRLAYLTARTTGDLLAAQARRKLSAAGGPRDDLRKAGEREPVAAAALGQVHAARLQDGREVVVKVQYPGVEKALQNDLANAAVLVRGFALAGDALDGRPYYDELRAALLRELDYGQEAAQADAYRQAAARYPELVVPEVVYERSARRVLCLQRIHGQPLLELMESDASSAERFRVARLLIFAIWGPFYAARLVHSDPHPGNFFVLPRGKLGVLDFGSTKMLSERFGSVYRVFLEENAAGRVHPDVGPMLKKAGFRFLGDDEEDAFEFCQKLDRKSTR